MTRVICVISRYDVPEVMCRDTARRECSDMAFLSPVTTSHYIQTAKPSYEGNCRPQTLSLDQQASTEYVMSSRFNNSDPLEMQTSSKEDKDLLHLL